MKKERGGQRSTGRDTHDDSVARSRVSSMSSCPSQNSSSELADDTHVMDAAGSIFDGKSYVVTVEEMTVRSTSLGGGRGGSGSRRSTVREMTAGVEKAAVRMLGGQRLTEHMNRGMMGT